MDELDLDSLEQEIRAMEGKANESTPPEPVPEESESIDLKKRIMIEDEFFKISFYYGGVIQKEIDEIIPALIEKFKDKDEDEDDDMGDLQGLVTYCFNFRSTFAIL